jgi:AcrR family transcriptional regulator
MYVKGKKAEQGDQTRRQLLDVARRLFAEQGFAGTATEEVVRQAGVTRGALYYHFRDKRDLFRAVVEDLLKEPVERLDEGARPDPWWRLRAALQAYLDACLAPGFQRIVLIDAPAVLSWSTRRDLDVRHAIGPLTMGLQALVDAGVIAPQPVEPLAYMLLGALSEGGLLIARAVDGQATRAAVGASLDRLLSGLRTPAR